MPNFSVKLGWFRDCGSIKFYSALFGFTTCCFRIHSKGFTTTTTLSSRWKWNDAFFLEVRDCKSRRKYNYNVFFQTNHASDAFSLLILKRFLKKIWSRGNSSCKQIQTSFLFKSYSTTIIWSDVNWFYLSMICISVTNRSEAPRALLFLGQPDKKANFSTFSHAIRTGNVSCPAYPKW